MSHTEIILTQMDRLNALKPSDPEQACRIAEAICKLAEQLSPTRELPTAEDRSDSLTFVEACSFLKMGQTTLNREIASDPNFPIYQPAGPKGRRYFSRAKLAEWQVSKASDHKQDEIKPGKVYRVD